MLSQDSLAVHAGRNGLSELGVHAVPIDLSTTAPLPSVHDGGLAYEHMATGGTHREGQSTVYQRLWNARSYKPHDPALEGHIPIGRAGLRAGC